MSPFAGYDDFDSCVRSNSDKADPQAYCAEIKRQVKGEGALSDDDKRALEESECDNGYVKANGECVKVEEVEDVPPGALDMSEPNIYQLENLATEPIERKEEGGQVRYTSVRLLGPGVWTDAESKETIWYSPRGISNLELDPDNTLNMMHDENNEVSDVGMIDPESVETDDDGYLYGDLVLHLDNSASEYADENLQATLESGGAKGFGGPSVEIRNHEDDVQYNEERGMRELVGGKLTGAALVSNPASKNVAFATQTAQRGVALSDSSQGVMVLEQDETHMDATKILEAVDVHELADAEDVQDDAQNIADELDVPVDEVLEVLDPLLDMDGEEEENEGDEQDMEDDEDDDEEDAEDEEGEEEEMDMETKVQSLEERLSNLEEMMESAMQAEDVEATLSDEIEDAKQDLADDETVQELEEAKEDLEKRLSELEEKPETPRSLADGEGESGEEREDGTVTMAREYDSRTGTISR